MSWGHKKLTFLNTVLYSLKGLRHGELGEVIRRFSYFWPLHLHKWLGWRYRKPVERYFKNTGITPVGGLSIDISSSNRNALFLYAYAIRHLQHLPGVKNLLAELAAVDRASDEDTSHDGERRYHNLMVELHGCYFVHKRLKMAVADVEYGTHKVLSPERQGNKSCDIKGIKSRTELYFECKDSSSEILSAEPYHGSFIATPRTDPGNKSWIEQKMQEADDKGADYLIAKIPIWSDLSGIEQYKDWMSSVFDDSVWEGGNRFTLPIRGRTFRRLKGVYILTLRDALTIRLV